MAVKGLQVTLNAMRKYSQDVQNEVKDAVEETTLIIERQAIANAPGAGDNVPTTYGSQKIQTNIAAYIDKRISNGGFTGEIFIEGRASVLALYIEFRTGDAARNYVPTLPIEFQEVARRYYVDGKGKLIGQPYLLPAFFQHSNKLIDKIKRILKNKKL